MEEVKDEIEAVECEGDARHIEVNDETLVAVARLLASLAVTVLATCGWAVDCDLVFNIILSVIAVACLVYGLWYKNANLTKAAQTSQKLLNALKKNDTKEQKECKAEGTD